MITSTPASGGGNRVVLSGHSNRLYTMTHPSFFKKPLSFAICFFLLFQYAQSQDNQPILAPRFLHEIGLDFAPFVRGQQGGSLIYKHKIGAVKVKKWRKQSALRLITGFYKNPIEQSTYQSLRNDTVFAESAGAYKANRYFVDIGFERQLDRNKLRFYYGAEVGYQGGTSNPVRHTEASVNGASFPYDFTQSKRRRNGPEISAFAGGNYFFLPHFSIGLEVHFTYGIDFSTTRTFRNGEMIRSDQNIVFVGATNLLHLLYLSYHF